MRRKNTSLANKLAKKNIQDTIWLGLAILAIVGIIMLQLEQMTTLMWELLVLGLYYIFYQLSKNDLMNFIDKLIDNEFKEFQKISETVLQLSEKQRQITNNYIEMLEKVAQTTKAFKNNAIKTREKTQTLTMKMQETYEYTGKEVKSLNENIELMQTLKQKIQIIAELIIELTNYVKQIGTTVSIVENISEQTNMLALNAAVEAARAGEYGKGFAVVASEIRKLADESKQATAKITNLVVDIEQTTSSTIVATEDGAKQIETDVKYAEGINKDFNLLISNIKELSIDLNDILSSTTDQQTITDDVLEVIENMQNRITESIKTVEENIENIKVFSEISTNIQDNIAN